MNPIIYRNRRTLFLGEGADGPPESRLPPSSLPAFPADPSQNHISLLRIDFHFIFWDKSLDWAGGQRRDLRKHRPGPPFPSAKPKGFRKERRKACGPSAPALKRSPPRDSAKRAAVPPTPPRSRKGSSPNVFEKWLNRSLTNPPLWGILIMIIKIIY